MRTATLVLMVALASCERSLASPATAAAAAEAVATVEVVQVKADKLDTTAPLPGELTAYEMVALYPRVNGFVDQIRGFARQ